MSLHRYDARRDSTELAIREALTCVGALYIQLDKFDLLVLYRGKLTMLDCKTPRGKRGTTIRTASQQKLLDLGFPLKFARTPEEAAKAIGAIR